MVHEAASEEVPQGYEVYMGGEAVVYQVGQTERDTGDGESDLERDPRKHLLELGEVCRSDRNIGQQSKSP